MRHFSAGELKSALDFALAGNQAVYSCRNRRQVWLIDHDITRLMATARRLGLRSPVVPVERPLLDGQHVVLSGAPMERALAETRQLELAKF